MKKTFAETAFCPKCNTFEVSVKGNKFYCDKCKQRLFPIRELKGLKLNGHQSKVLICETKQERKTRIFLRSLVITLYTFALIVFLYALYFVVKYFI